MRIERRRVIQAILGLGVILQPVRAVAGTSVPSRPASLRDKHRQAALARLGQACLRAHPWLAESEPSKPFNKAQRFLPDQISEDFREQRTLLVNGWLLAESEAVYYAHVCRMLTA